VPCVLLERLQLCDILRNLVLLGGKLVLFDGKLLLLGSELFKPLLRGGELILFGGQLLLRARELFDTLSCRGEVLFHCLELFRQFGRSCGYPGRCGGRCLRERSV
jgi:hypothetical protein